MAEALLGPRRTHINRLSPHQIHALGGLKKLQGTGSLLIR